MKISYQELTRQPIFRGVSENDLKTMLECLGAYERSFKKGEYIALSSESVKCVSVILRGTVHMVSEDIWGNKTILVFMHRDELFGETFACGSSTASIVSFFAAEEVHSLYLPFDKIMHSCSNACAFHHRLIENVLTMIADKNIQLMQKVEIISKRTLREKLLTYFSLQAQLQGSKHFELPVGRIGLADYLCADRSALTRELNRMKEENLIDFHKNSFVLLK